MSKISLDVEKGQMSHRQMSPGRMLPVQMYLNAHSEMNILSIIWFIILIMLIVVIFSRPHFLASRRG